MFQYLFFRVCFLIIGFILLIDGSFLIFKGQIHLGTVLPLLIGAIFCIYVIFNQKITEILSKNIALKKYWRWGWTLFGIWVITLFVFFAYLKYQNQPYDASEKIDSIIVLGSGLVQGKPSPILASRLDRAAQVATQHPQALIIVSGGLGYQQRKTEAEAMSNYLQKNFAINPSRIRLESNSTSTELNLKNSEKILNQNNLDSKHPIAIVTSDFHILRATAIAHHQGYQHVIGIAAPTPIMTRYNAWLREYFAYISGWILNEY